MIEVFKTNVNDFGQSETLISHLHAFLPGCIISFDLEDCDKILRIAGSLVPGYQVQYLLNVSGFTCELLN